jgi:hypothetical protein
MSECGYIKLHRKALDSRVFQNDGLWRLWTWCLLKSNFREGWISVKTGKGESQVKILPGQFVFGRKSAAKELKENPETIRKRMDKLKNIGNITIESTSQYSIITIVNWDSYQNYENKSTTESTSQVPAKYQPSTTIEEGKEGKEENNMFPPVAKTACPFNEILNTYHGTLPELPTMKVLTEARRGYIKARWNEHGRDLGWWKDYFLSVKESDFLCGRAEAYNGRKPFMADLEWLVKPSNMAKVIEGKYKNCGRENKKETVLVDKNGIEHNFG